MSFEREMRTMQKIANMILGGYDGGDGGGDYGGGDGGDGGGDF